VLRLAHEVPTNLNRSAGLYLVAKARVMNKDEENTLDFEPNCARCIKSIRSPPLRCTGDLALGAGLDYVSEGHGQP
jgi:hypothetical protein